MVSQAVILAGGRARRLHPVTRTIPKVMLNVAGKPFIAHQLDLLRKNGITRVIICAGYLGKQIEDFVKDGRKFGLKVDFSFDGRRLLGTGGAIKKALPLLDNVFFIIYGDSYLDIDFKPIGVFFFSNNKSGLITVFKNSGRWDTSNIIYENGKIIKYDKKNITNSMKHIDYGLSILKKDIFMNVDYGSVFDLADIYRDLVERDEMVAYEVKKRFYEIGSLESLEETGEYLRKIALFDERRKERN